MSRPLLLDLFCGAGGAAVGYGQAGFDIVGIDKAPQPDYPFRFIQGDVMEDLWPGWWEDFDAVHASPPCQAYTVIKTAPNHRTDHPELVEPVREMLVASRLPYVMENVPGAPLKHTLVLCGSSFGLGVEVYDGWRELRRHRWFETNVPMMAPPCQHTKATIGIYGDHARDRRRKGPNGKGLDFPDSDKLYLARTAMGMPWANWRGLSQAIPPAYTRFIGERLLEHISSLAPNTTEDREEG